jgi:hypothetical protein
LRESPALKMVSAPLSNVSGGGVTVSRMGPPPSPCGSLVPFCQIARLGSVGLSAPQWYPSRRVNASASAQWNGMSSWV